MRTAKEIVDQTNELARHFYAMQGYEVPKDFRFDTETENRHPDERACWAMACAAQLLLTDTDVEDAMQELDAGEDVEADYDEPGLRLERAAEKLEAEQLAPQTGWGNPRPFDSKSKFHYFQSNGMSLCRKWARLAGSPAVEEGMDDHKHNCAACKKLMAKYRKAAA